MFSFPKPAEKVPIDQRSISEIFTWAQNLHSDVAEVLHCDPSNLEGWKGDTLIEACRDVLLELEGIRATLPNNIVGFFGERGSGKSTLLNLLIGTPLLPEYEYAATTAAITEVTYWEHSEYWATISFISKDDWKDMTSKDSTLPKSDLIEMVDALSGGNPSPLKNGVPELPKECIELIEKSSIICNFKTVEELRKFLVRYNSKWNGDTSDDESSDSDDNDDYNYPHPYYWPIVNRIHVRGPFQAWLEFLFPYLIFLESRMEL